MAILRMADDLAFHRGCMALRVSGDRERMSFEECSCYLDAAIHKGLW